MTKETPSVGRTFGISDSLMNARPKGYNKKEPEKVEEDKVEENVEETNNEQGDEDSPLSSGDGDRGNALRFHGCIYTNVTKFFFLHHHA